MPSLCVHFRMLGSSWLCVSSKPPAGAIGFGAVVLGDFRTKKTAQTPSILQFKTHLQQPHSGTDFHEDCLGSLRLPLAHGVLADAAGRKGSDSQASRQLHISHTISVPLPRLAKNTSGQIVTCGRSYDVKHGTCRCKAAPHTQHHLRTTFIADAWL